MSETTDRIEEISGRGDRRDRAPPRRTAELEELRVRHLGRKAELTTILRGISELPAEERGPVGKAGNQVRQALEALIESRGAELDAAELSAEPRRRPRRRDPARLAAAAPSATCTS